MATKKTKSFYLSDHWTTTDALNFGVFKPALMDILQNAATPLTVGVFGTWGSGKTSLLRMLEAEIKDKGLAKFRSVWFTAWKYDKQDALWRAFILRVVDALYPEENGTRIPLEKLGANQQDGVKHLDRLAESLYQTVSWKGEESWSLDLHETAKETVKLPIWLALHLARLGDAAKGLGIDPDLAKLIGREAQTHYMQQLTSMEQFELSFQEAIEKILGKDGRLIVFVDDLDRCMPEKAIEILEAIKLFLHVPQTIFVLGMDREIVRRGVESHYGIYLRDEKEERAELPINGDVYLQKLIQLPFNLPPLDASGRGKFIENLQKEMASDATLDDLTREVFARGLLPNPRQVKRALNVYRLLRVIAVEQERQKLLPVNSIAPPLLAKTVLIQSQWPELYALWRQYPTLVQTLEAKYGEEPPTELEMILGQTEKIPEAQAEVGDEKQAPRTREAASRPQAGGVLAPFLTERRKYALLMELLNFPEGDSEEEASARFSGLTRSALQAYLGLAGTAEQDAPEELERELPSDLTSQLQSGDPAILQEVFSRLAEQEVERDGPLHQGAKRILVEGAQSAEFEPARRVNLADAAEQLGYEPDDLSRFIPVPNAEAPAFWLGKYTVTNRQYARFLDAPDFAKEAYWLNFPKFDENSQAMQGNWSVEGWEWLEETLKESNQKVLLPRLWDDKKYGQARPFAPVVGISWYEANAYANWLLANWTKWPESETLAKPASLRLPTRAEWVQAAGGAEPEERFPWDEVGKSGTTQSKDDQTIPTVTRHANVSESKIGRTSPVWTYPQGVSQPYGLMDLGGNVWEWQASYRNKSHNTLQLSGGSWGRIWYYARVSALSSANPHFWDASNGFRVLALPS
jgi:formylglycine-generating enzyme required for sulfatase activity